MTLEQAIQQQVEIICENEQERDEVVKILEAGGLKRKQSALLNGNGNVISIYRNVMRYFIDDVAAHDFPNLAASQFIAANKINNEINPPLTC